MSAAYVNSDGPAQPIIDALSSVQDTTVTATFRTASILTFHRDHQMYEWTNAKPIPIGALRTADGAVTTFSTASRAHLRRARPTAQAATARTGASNRRGMSSRVTRRRRPGSPGSRRCGAAAFAAPFGRKPYGATAAARGTPVTRPCRSPPYGPMPRQRTRARPSACAGRDRVRKGHSHRDGTPRIVQIGPSSVKGAPRSFLTASQKGSSGPTLERRSLCRPSRPDGKGQAEGQAQDARGKTSQDARLSTTERYRA